MNRCLIPVLAFLSVCVGQIRAAEPLPPATAPKAVPATREELKDALEAHKKARPRLPLPPEETGDKPMARVNNARFRAYYLLAELRDSGFTREPDPAMTLNNTFKVQLFWITSRTNNCYYCMGHQEHKLAAANLSDDEIAALDGDWKAYPEKERVAFAFTRKLALSPHLVGAADLEQLRAHYTPAQVLEIIATVAGYASTNRWTDGLNIPAEDSAEFFRKSETKADFKTFKTPTSPKFADLPSLVAPLPAKCLKASKPLVPERPALESREVVEAHWKIAKLRLPALPLGEDAVAKELWGGDGAPNWVKALAVFPKASRGRVAGLKAAMEKGNITPRLKAAIAWAAAREDRAWYALAVARDRLKVTGFTDDKIFALDGEKADLTERERLVVAFARKLTVAPSYLTDTDVESLRKVYNDKDVAEIVYHVCNAAYFNRLTEAANLPLD